MKQKFYFLMSLFWIFNFSNAQTLDQSWAPSSTGGGIFSASPSQNVGQTFTAGVTGDLSQISLRLINSTAAPSTTFVAGDFQIRIFNGDGYSGTVLNTTVINISSVPTSYIEQTITLSTFVPVTAGNKYTIDFRGVTGTVGIQGADPGYPDNFYFSNGNTALAGSYDLWFKSFVIVPTPATHLNFDGVDDFVNCGTSLNSVIDPLNTITVEAWVNPSTNTSLGVIVGNYANPNQSSMQFLLRRENNNYGFWIQGTGTFKNVTANNSVVLNTWQHVAGVWNGSDLKIYINGVLAGTTTGVTDSSFATTTNSMFIGNNQFSGNPEEFTGSIDEVRIWNFAKNVEQINGAKNCELQGSQSGLIAYYNFNQGIDAQNNSGVTTLNAVTGPNGTLTNFTLSGATSNWLAGSPVTTGSIVPSAATVTTPVVYTQGDTATPLTATVGPNGSGLLWYTTAAGGVGTTTAPTPNTTSVGNTSYWVSSTNANGCESPRTVIVVTVNVINDECLNATNLTVGTTSFNDFPANVSLTGATNSGIPTPTCGNFQGGDVWYTATVPASGNLVIETNGAGNYDSGLEVYTGTCGTLSLVSCDDNSGNGSYSKITLFGQTPGTVLRIRVWENFFGISNAQFQVSAYDYIVPATHLNFDGINDYVDIPKTFTSDFTIQYWLRTSSTGTTGGQWYNGHSIVDNEVAGVTSDFGTSLNGSKLAFGIGNPDTTILSTSNINDGTWKHVTVTWKQSTGVMQIYINGALEASGVASTAARTASSFIKIGTSNNFGSYFNGDIDDLRIWNNVLTATDITNTMNCEAQTQPELIAYYKLNQGFDMTSNTSVTTATDSSGNGNNGTLTNFTLSGATSNWAAGSTITSGNTCIVLNSTDFEAGKEIKIYPNPSNGIFNILAQENISIELYDVVGKLIMNQKLSIGTNSFDISNFNAGVYLLKVTNNNGNSETHKLIKN